ncbi:hypothetical protein AAHH80_41920, partial [Burkholderia pseudomallei]
MKSNHKQNTLKSKSTGKYRTNQKPDLHKRTHTDKINHVFADATEEHVILEANIPFVLDFPRNQPDASTI